MRTFRRTRSSSVLNPFELATLLPFGSIIAIKNKTAHKKIDGRGIEGICLGPDPRFGRGAISVLVGGVERHTRTFKFLEPPGHATEPVPDEVQPATTGNGAGRASLAAMRATKEVEQSIFIEGHHG